VGIVSVGIVSVGVMGGGSLSTTSGTLREHSNNPQHNFIVTHRLCCTWAIIATTAEAVVVISIAIKLSSAILI
jgi:hypothetical protein